MASLALGASSDPRLLQLAVHSVRASSDGSKLIVHVVPTDVVEFSELDQLMSALDHARPWLRQQVASEIYRKRIPDIAFQIILNPDMESP